MKKVIILFAFLLTACSSMQSVESTIEKIDKVTKVSYYPIQPVNFSDFYSRFDYFNGEKSPAIIKALENVDTEKDKLLGLFPNESARVYIEEYSLDGKISYGVASVSKKDKIYHITVDYLKYRTDSIIDTVYVSGFGLRMRARIKSNEKGLDLSNLFALGVAASEKKVSGSLEFDTIGISGPQITPLVPIPSSLSPESIASAIQALAAIKAKLYADNKSVKVWPQIAGTVGGAPIENLNKLLTSSKKTIE